MDSPNMLPAGTQKFEGGDGNLVPMGLRCVMSCLTDSWTEGGRRTVLMYGLLIYGMWIMKNNIFHLTMDLIISSIEDRRTRLTPLNSCHARQPSFRR